MIIHLYTLAQATQPAVPPSILDKNWWAEFVAMVVVVVFVKYVRPWLLAQKDKLEAETSAAQAAKRADTVQTNQVILERLKSFLTGTAAAIAEKRFGWLARDILDDQYPSADKVREEMRTWGTELRNKAIEYFQHQDIDIVRLVGQDYLNLLVERAANDVSPFPGKETAKEMFDKRNARVVSKYGINFVRAEIDKNGSLEGVWAATEGVK